MLLFALSACYATKAPPGMVRVRADSVSERREIRRCVGDEVVVFGPESAFRVAYSPAYQYAVLAVRAGVLAPRDCASGDPVIHVTLPRKDGLPDNALLQAQRCLSRQGRVAVQSGIIVVTDQWKSASQVTAALIEYSEAQSITRPCGEIPAWVFLGDADFTSHPVRMAADWESVGP